MVARSRARFLAPIALALVIAGTVLVVEKGLKRTHPAQAQNHLGTTATTNRPPAARHRRAASSFYVVKPGDSLSAISARSGVPLPTLESLNPGVDPNSLQTGQRLRLRR